jgi:hypothetical protein
VVTRRYGGHALYIDTDAGSYPTGEGQPRSALDWERDLVVAAIATADAPEAPA